MAEMMGPGKKDISYYLVIDADSITGKMIDALFQSLSDYNMLQIVRADICGKNEPVLYKYCEKFNGLSNDAVVNIHKMGSLQNEADIFCAVATGMILQEILMQKKSDESAIAIISNDKLVVSIGSIVQENNVGLVLLDSVKSSRIDYDNSRLKLLSLVSTKPEEKKSKMKEVLPQSWYFAEDNGTSDHTGLICKKVAEIKDYPAPKFIPFPSGMRSFTIGSNGDVSLKPWDVEKGLYDRNVEIEYCPIPKSCWALRSLKGFRRGNKEIKVDGSIISASSASVGLSQGDLIELGAFTFELQTNRTEDFIQFEDPKVLIEIIEKSLKKAVETIPLSSIPDYILSELEDENGTASLEHAYFRHYRKIIKAKWWAKEFQSFRNGYHDKQSFDSDFIEINEIRNTVFHSSKPALTDSQKRKLVDFYLNLENMGIICPN